MPPAWPLVRIRPPLEIRRIKWDAAVAHPFSLDMVSILGAVEAKRDKKRF